MKTISILTTVLVFLATSLTAQPKINSKESIVKKINLIDKELVKFEKVQQHSDSVGSRVSYLNNEELVKVEITVTQNHVSKNVEWYFSNGQLIYSEQKWLDLNNEKQIVNNEKLFLAQNQLISWIKTDGQEVDSNTVEFSNAEVELLKFAHSLQIAVR